MREHLVFALGQHCAVRVDNKNGVNKPLDIGAIDQRTDSYGSLEIYVAGVNGDALFEFEKACRAGLAL